MDGRKKCLMAVVTTNKLGPGTGVQINTKSLPYFRRKHNAEETLGRFLKLLGGHFNLTSALQEKILEFCHL